MIELLVFFNEHHKQALDWPLVSTDYAIGKLETSKSLIEVKDYPAIAQSIKEEIELRGPAKWVLHFVERV